MVHKVVEIIKKEGKMPYTETTVPFDKSFGEVQQLLRKFGCEEVFTRSQLSSIPKMKVSSCTIHSIGFIHKGSKFLLEFPVTVVVQGRHGEDKKVNMDISGRIVLNKVKSLLVDVEINYLSFEQAMLPYQLVAARDGRAITVMEMVDENRSKLGNVGAMECLLLGSDVK